MREIRLEVGQLEKATLRIVRNKALRILLIRIKISLSLRVKMASCSLSDVNT